MKTVPKRATKWIMGFGLVIFAIALAAVFGTGTAFAAPAADVLSGCTGEYFNNTSLSGSPVFVRTDPAINFSWAAGTSPAPGINVAQYSVRWTCTVNVTTAGTYTITNVADDGMNVLVDGNLLTWAWYDQGPTTYSNSIYLGVGTHTVRVEYYNDVGGGTAQVTSNIVGTPIYNPAPAPAPAPVSVPVIGNFLTNCTGQYFNNISLAGSPAFVRVDPVLNFYWREYTSPGAGLGVNNYSVRWTCPVNVVTAGTYSFYVLTDDGMNVWVDNNLVIGAWFDQPPVPYANSIYLNPGAHTVRVEYYNRTLGGTAQVSSNLSGTTIYNPVPAPYYNPAPAPYAGGFISNCTGEYFNNMTLDGSPVVVRTDPGINFYWPANTSPAGGVNSSQYSVRWTCTINVPSTGTYTATMLTDDGMNVLVDGNLIIWAWYDQGPSVYSNPVYLTAGTHTVVVQYYNDTLGGTAQVSLR